MDMQLEIANAFERLFCSLGYKKTTVDRVANELKISKKTIYKYYKGKEEVYQYLVDRFAQSEVEVMENELQTIADEAEKLDRVNGFCFLRLQKAIEAGKQEEFSFYYPCDIVVEAFQRAYRQLIRTILLQGSEKGIFQIDDLDLCMEYLEALIAKSIELAKTGTYPNIVKQNMEMVLKIISK
ncbi:MAG: TetR/AcrR family transcriptional regulator [Marinifilaceae bacterium]